MSQLIKVKIGEEEIWWEADDDAYPEGAFHEAVRGYRDVSAAGQMEKALDAAGDAVKTIKAYCSLLYKSFNESDHKPDKVTAEFGVKLTAQGNVFVAKATGEAGLKVTAEWNLNR